MRRQLFQHLLVKRRKSVGLDLDHQSRRAHIHDVSNELDGVLRRGNVHTRVQRHVQQHLKNKRCISIAAITLHAWN